MPVDENGELDLSHLTPTEARLYAQAVKFYRHHFGFTMDMLIAVWALELDTDAIMYDALEVNRINSMKRRGVWYPTQQPLED